MAAPSASTRTAVKGFVLEEVAQWRLGTLPCNARWFYRAKWMSATNFGEPMHFRKGNAGTTNADQLR